MNMNGVFNPIFIEPAWVMIAVFIRIAAAMNVIPAFGEQVISVRVKLTLAILLTVVVSPVVSHFIEVREITLYTICWLIITESINGIFLGLVLRMFIFAVQTAGAIAAQSTSLSQLLGQAGMDPLPAIGHILTMAALGLLMITGYHIKVTEFIISSYHILPALKFPNASDVAQAGHAQVSRSFALAFTISAPFVILSVIYNLTLGAINKAMPQLMVAFVGAPVITFGAIATLLLASPFMLAAWIQAFDGFLAAPFR